MSPTGDTDLDALIAAILSGVRATLGEKLVGLYVFGSIATGHFERDISDVDLVAALASDLTGDEFERLESLHVEIIQAQPRWQDRLEIAYIALDDMRRIQPDAEIALISPGEPFHVKAAGNDWYLNLYTLRERGLTACGPAPCTVIDAVFHDDLATALKRLMLEWRVWMAKTDLIHRRRYQGHMIITMCRALFLFRGGRIASKREATSWAERELPEWSSLIANALGWREANDDDQIDQDAMLPETLRFVRFAIDSILRE